MSVKLGFSGAEESATRHQYSQHCSGLSSTSYRALLLLGKTSDCRHTEPE